MSGNLVIKKPSVDKLTPSDELNIPVYDAGKNKVEILLSIKKWKASIEGSIKKPKIDLRLKKDKNKKNISSSLSSFNKKKKKKDRFSFEIGGNLDIKKSSIDRSKFSVELNVSVLDADKSNIKIVLSIRPQKSRLEN
jgi:hypothetical protein